MLCCVNEYTIPSVLEDHTGLISSIKQSKNQNIWPTEFGQEVVDLTSGTVACISTKEKTLTEIGRMKVYVKLKLSVCMPLRYMGKKRYSSTHS
jgi:hypothetical protein